MKKQANPKVHEQGSVIVWIMIGIALFAALGFAMNQGSRVGGNQMDAEKARLAASEILNYAGQMRSAVQQLKINGCQETQISFQSAETSTQYQNTNAPSNNSCHVFHPDGGGMRYILPDIDSFTTPRYIGFDANHCIDKIGTTSTCTQSEIELVMAIYNLKQDVCLKINEALGVDNPGNIPSTEASSHATTAGVGAFTGTYGPAGLIYLGDSPTTLSGKNAGCYQDSNGFSQDYYIFYQVLLAR